METVIAQLVQRFERGRLSRRDLIQGLSVLVAAASAAPAAAQSVPTLQATGINHLGVLVSDVKRSADFYANAFGMKLLSEDKARGIARLGVKGTLVSLRQAQPTGTVDHFAVALDGFNKDAVTAALKAKGINTSEDADSGFHVKDPDGANVQLQ
jgi:catechol 2,3-dioxygenase-like lactoylglutathione lyase family enzyme